MQRRTWGIRTISEDSLLKLIEAQAHPGFLPPSFSSSPSPPRPPPFCFGQLRLEMKHPGFVLCFSRRKGQAFHSYKAVDSLSLETIALRLAAFITNVSQLVHCKTRVDRGGEGSEGSERQSRGFVRY